MAHVGFRCDRLWHRNNGLTAANVLFEVIAAQPDPQSRHGFGPMGFGSAMDTLRRFPPAGAGDPIQGSFAATATAAFDGGPLPTEQPGEAGDRPVMPRGGNTLSAICVQPVDR